MLRFRPESVCLERTFTSLTWHAFRRTLARFQRAFVLRIAVTPGIASLNPGLMSSQPFRAAGLHAGGVKEISPR